MIELVRGNYSDKVRGFVNDHPDSSVYHLDLWGQLIEQVYGYDRYTIVSWKNGSIDGVMPIFLASTLIGGRRLISLPFSHKVSILTASAEGFNSIVSGLKRLCLYTNCERVYLKAPIDDPGFTLSKVGFNAELSLLSGYSSTSKRFKTKVKRSIKKCLDSDTEISIDNSEYAKEEFYKLMVETRRRQGAPVYSRRLFDFILRNLSPSGIADFYIAKFEGVCCAGIIVLKYKGIAIYAYGAMSNSKVIKRVCPNHGLFRQAIEDCCEAGFSSFDFGSTPIWHSSLLDFKKSWGAEITDSYWSSVGAYEDMRTGFRFRLASKFFEVLPSPISPYLGPAILRQVGV